ncbi:MAG: hypothetical protein JWR38_3960 [Mucilaginibacter sp.]|nr:hypothetical protein [Mucilaginibacter sp.]
MYVKLKDVVNLLFKIPTLIQSACSQFLSLAELRDTRSQYNASTPGSCCLPLLSTLYPSAAWCYVINAPIISMP